MSDISDVSDDDDGRPPPQDVTARMSRDAQRREKRKAKRERFRAKREALERQRQNTFAPVLRLTRCVGPLLFVFILAFCYSQVGTHHTDTLLQPSHNTPQPERTQT